jgi:hypothetical protein
MIANNHWIWYICEASGKEFTYQTTIHKSATHTCIASWLKVVQSNLVQSTFCVFLKLKSYKIGYMVFILESLIGFPSIIWLSTIIEIINNEHLSIACCNLKMEFKDGRYGELRIQVFFPRFCSKAMNIHIILNGSIWKRIILFYLKVEEDCFYTIVIDMRYEHVVHYLCAIYALVYILQSSWPDIIIAIIWYLVAALLYQMLVD